MALLEEARDRVLMGPERKSMVRTEESKRLTAYHEGGHALVALLTNASMLLHKATILPRGQALGLTHLLPEDDQHSLTKKQLLARMDVAMGGRVAEELIFGYENATTGASNDLHQANRIARQMIHFYGFGSNLEAQTSRTINSHRISPSLEKKKTNDKEMQELLNQSYNRAKKLLTEHINDLHKLAEALLKYETLSADEINRVLKGEDLNR